jgi:hypothetical protein
MPETPNQFEEPSVITFIVELVAALLYHGALLLIPAALLAIPIHWMLADAFIPPMMDALGTASDGFRPLFSGLLYLFALFASGLAVHARLS